MLFPSDAERIQKAKKYFSAYPGVDRVIGVETAIDIYDQHGKPDYLSDEVWSSLCLEVLEAAVKMANERHYDVIQIEHSYMAWIVPLLRMRIPKTTYVLDLHNAEYRIYEKWIPYAKDEEREHVFRRYKTLHQWEMLSWKWFDAALTVSSVESELFKKVTGNPNVYEVPTGGGIEIDGYTPDESQTEKPYDLLYLGTMEWFPNAQGLMWFIENVFPIILRNKPDVKLNIVGYGNPNSKLISMAEENHNIVFWGQQPDDKKFFHGSKVFIVPLFIGAGARVKIPTAWASKVPIVCTEFAAEGLQAKNGENISMADDPREFADLVLRTLTDSAYARHISENAYRTAMNSYSADACVKRLIEIYRELVQ